MAEYSGRILQIEGGMTGECDGYILKCEDQNGRW